MSEEMFEGFRLSPQQKKLWLLQQSSDFSLSYRVQCTILIEGNIDENALKSALKLVVDRQEILRTNFRCLPGMIIAVQVINENGDLKFDYDDLSDLSVDKQEAKIEARFNELLQLPFNLEQGQILRLSLGKLLPHKYVLLVSLPAMNADRVTLRNLVGEISRCYTASLHGEELCDRPMQYADVAEWQNDLLEAEDTQEGREFWHKQDLSSLVNLKLPFEKKQPEDTFSPQVLTYNLDNVLVARIENLAQKYESTLSDFLLACWQILIGRLTGETEVILGAACDGRKYQELESALGLFSKFLPLRCNLAGDLQFTEVLKLSNVAELYEWQEYFSWEDTSSNLSFFPVTYEFDKQVFKDYNNINWSIDKQYACIDQFKLKLLCLQKNDNLTAEFHYDGNLFQQHDIERLARQFQTLLSSAVNQPQALISQLEILSKSDRIQLLDEFNRTKIDYPSHCIHHLFEEQVTRTPNNIAVVFEDRQFTYLELNARANQVARYLQKIGVAPEVIVGLCVERSLDMLVGMLGILKAGGAYLPLDPILPSERLAYILEDAKPPVLVTQQHLIDKLPQHSAQVCLDDWDLFAQQSTLNFDTGTKPENLVYAIYTSGSTGKPKAVAVEHQQLLNYVYGIVERLKLPSGASFAIASSFAADLGNTAIFPSLSTGGCLHILSQSRLTDASAFADYCRHHAIDCLKIVPSHLKALLSTHGDAILPRQRLILGGEVVEWNLIEQIQRYAASECQIYNHYGPTETTVGVTGFAVECGDNYATDTVPLGRPLANTQIYLLDRYLQPVPLGVTGEIYIGGAGLARGYLNNPDLTAERFISNPFWGSGETEVRSQKSGVRSQESGVRSQESGVSSIFPPAPLPLCPPSPHLPIPPSLYKTGDKARYLPDGNIEFLGRIDNQVKIRGYRIELGEIEIVLCEHPDVQATAVLVRESTQLVAYVVPQPGRNLNSSSLSDWLKQKLPEYMIPATFVMLDALPLMPNGKVDRQALPALQVRPTARGYVAPRTPVEEILAAVWSQVLGVAQVGIHDNFFELGGDSIISIGAIARANQAGVRLTPKQLFQHQTIAQLATVADTTALPCHEQGLVTGSVPLTPIQHWFFEQELLDPHHWNQAILLVVQQLDPLLIKQVVQQLLIHHDALRLRFECIDGWQQINAQPDNSVPFDCIDLSALPETEQAAAMEAAANELQASLNLSAALVRVALFNLGSDKPSRLLFIIHHLVVDGVSWRILLEDFQTAYQQLCRGEQIALPSKTTSFQQWALRLQVYAQSTQQQELDYWLAIGQSQLPVDVTNNVTASVSVALNEAQTQALLQQVPQAYHTQINDVLLTALIQTFAQWTGERSLLVDLEGHGREDDVDLSRTVGWFTTIFPVWLDLGNATTPGEALKTIKEQLRKIPNRGIGYGVLRYLSACEKTRSLLSNLPQAEVKFNYLGQFDQILPADSLFAAATESTGISRSQRDSQRHLLDVVGFIAGGCLRMEWTGKEAAHQSGWVKAVALGFIEELRSLIAHCQSLDTGEFTPSDFPKAGLNQKDLDKILNQCGSVSATHKTIF